MSSNPEHAIAQAEAEHQAHYDQRLLQHTEVLRQLHLLRQLGIDVPSFLKGVSRTRKKVKPVYRMTYYLTDDNKLCDYRYGQSAVPAREFVSHSPQVLNTLTETGWRAVLSQLLYLKPTLYVAAAHLTEHNYPGMLVESMSAGVTFPAPQAGEHSGPRGFLINISADGVEINGQRVALRSLDDFKHHVNELVESSRQP